MSNLDRVQENINKKLKLQDYKTEIPQEVKTSPQKKMKLTIYLTEEAMRKFNEICGKKVIQNGKTDKSNLICKAIDLLYDSENK